MSRRPRGECIDLSPANQESLFVLLLPRRQNRARINQKRDIPELATFSKENWPPLRLVTL
jgi:hypothetical protein